MAVMDEFKEERAALKNASLKTKLSYFWEYYKWHVIITVGVIAFVVSLVHQITSAKDTGFYAVMLNATLLTIEDEYAADFADYAEIDADEYDVFFDTSMRIIENSIDDTTYTTVQKLMVYTAAADLDVMITDGDSIRKYANSSTFYDLRDILNEEQIEKYEPYFYYVDQKVVEEIEAAGDALDDTFVPSYPDPANPDEMDTPIPVGLYLDSNDYLQENFYFRGEGEEGEHVVIGVYCNTTRLDAALKYIDFVMEATE